MAVEGDTASVLVGRSEWNDVEDFAEVGSWHDRTAFTGLQPSNVLGVLPVDHGHLTVLHCVDLKTMTFEIMVNV